MSLLRLLRQRDTATVKFVMTEYVARHELHDVASDIATLEEEKRLKVEPVSTRKSDPQGQRFREYRSEGMDKGEAESLAWVKGATGELPLFISNDGGARNGFARHRAPVGDVMDLIVEAVTSGAVQLAEVREVASVAWDGRPNNQCRPKDYSAFDATFEQRRTRRS
ncbi:MAG TPA: hypothetical protein VHG72_06760 [Polyangia bacterium]|nr:hypothetical protein [Polyangia bacterium]